ncbi:hypothetical protein [Leptolyngbya sp. 7M]|uniref:hypothetical protein n=1 Tax=Leptolyngbya sp. 7M TaxID=2812896 RepID=UPI001B8B7AC4|nr:hypothetical protein [Leptolyngbya sp. 7M]QYO63069.1 hypothetical protein JVX88_24300 [Leptolyngbya sp. 7M]
MSDITVNALRYRCFSTNFEYNPLPIVEKGSDLLSPPYPFQPVNRMLGQILSPLQDQIDELAADPFDDELLEEFLIYLEDCRDYLQRAQQSFRSMPNPSNVAGVAAHLYYCLNQVGDGIDELERFTTSYDEHYLHTGQELFRIAYGLRREAQAAMKDIQ